MWLAPPLALSSQAATVGLVGSDVSTMCSPAVAGFGAGSWPSAAMMARVPSSETWTSSFWECGRSRNPTRWGSAGSSMS